MLAKLVISMLAVVNESLLSDISILPRYIVDPERYKSLHLLSELPKSYVVVIDGIRFVVT